MVSKVHISAIHHHQEQSNQQGTIHNLCTNNQKATTHTSYKDNEHNGTTNQQGTINHLHTTHIRHKEQYGTTLNQESSTVAISNVASNFFS